FLHLEERERQPPRRQGAKKLTWRLGVLAANSKDQNLTYFAMISFAFFMILAQRAIRSSHTSIIPSKMSRSASKLGLLTVSLLLLQPAHLLGSRASLAERPARF